MSLETRLVTLAQAIGTDVKTLYTAQGALSGLTTSNKTSLVAAINELKSSITAGAATINDTGSSTASTWSSTKISSEISSAVSALVGAAPDALNTLVELATELQSQDSVVDGLVTAVSNRVRFDGVQSLSAAQQTQARDNIGAASLAAIGNPERDFAADYAASKA